MQLEVFEALTSINVSPADARSVAASLDVAIRRAVNDTYAVATAELVTRADLKAALAGLATKDELRAEIAGVRAEFAGVRGEIAGVRGEIHAAMVTQTKWMVGVMIALTGFCVAAVKFIH